MATDDSLLIAADAPSIYRPASPTRLLVYGGIAVAFALLAGLAFNDWAVGRYVWLGAGLLALGSILVVLGRINAQSSEHIQIDSDSITWVSRSFMPSAMLDAGADPNAGSLTHPPPLILAAERGHLAIVQLLVERGANPDISFEGWNALRAAKLRGHDKTIAYLTVRQKLLPEKP